MAEENKKRCGLIMPISSMTGINIKYTAEHWEEVKLTLMEFLGNDYNVNLVSNGTGIIQTEILNSIFSSDIVICDISGSNPNVMFELGLRIALNKRVLVIYDNSKNTNKGVPFDINAIPYLEYSEDLNRFQMKKFEENLKVKIQELLKEDGNSYINTYGEFLKNYVINKKEIDISIGDLILEKIEKLERKLIDNVKNSSEDSLFWSEPFLIQNLKEDFNKSFLIQKLLNSVYNDFYQGAVEYILLKYPNLKEYISIYSTFLQDYYIFNNKLKDDIDLEEMGIFQAIKK
nr:MAG TPA: CMP/hydroxymethyl CMP hydrolase [Caudoviricetes sp.]